MNARVYEVDPLRCKHCGGAMKIVALMIQASENRSILEHPGLPAEAPRMHQARGSPQNELWPWQGDTDEHRSDVDAADQDKSVCW